jgi:hypothetical protein
MNQAISEKSYDSSIAALAQINKQLQHQNDELRKALEVVSFDLSGCLSWLRYRGFITFYIGEKDLREHYAQLEINPLPHIFQLRDVGVLDEETVANFQKLTQN